MRTRRLGKTGLEVSELALGTWGLSGDAYGPVASDEVDRVLDRALEGGVTLFDTADVYGGGAMETKLGERLPKEAMVVTKLGTRLDVKPPRKVFSPDYLREAFERSRERLRRQTIDVVLLHNPSVVALDDGEAVGFLKALKTLGHIKAWGASVGSVDSARAAISRGADVIELPYNVFVAKDLHALAADLGEHETGVLARSVLAHGVLTGAWTADRELPPGDHRAARWTKPELERRIAQLSALRPVVGGVIASLRSAALRFVLVNDLVSSAVLGPRTSMQLEQLLKDVSIAPPYMLDATLTALGKRLEELGLSQ